MLGWKPQALLNSAPFSCVASVIAGKFKTSFNSNSFFPPSLWKKKASVNIRWLYQAFWDDARVLYPEKSRGDSAQNVPLFFPPVRFLLTWHCAPSHRIIRAEAFSPFAKPSVSRGEFGRRSDFHVNRSLLAGVYTSLSPPDALSPALCLSRAHLPLPAVASPNTQSHCCCRATLPFTSQPLFTSALFPPSLSLFLSGLMNGVAGLWAAHPRRGVASHRWLSHQSQCLGFSLLFSFT